MLRKSSLAYPSILWLLFQLLVEINCQITPFEPRQRYAHTATLINDKLYILGGRAINNDSYDVGKDFFYLDFSVKFDTSQDSLWQDLSSINTVPSHYGATSVKGGENNNTLILYGGFNSTEMELVYTFDPQSNSWSTPKIVGPRDAYLTGVVNYGKMYLWGGMNETKLDADSMFVLDTVNFNLEKGDLTFAPAPSQNYGAVLLPNNYIIYMGGYSMSRNTEMPFNQIFVYDTINDKWSTQATTGTVPSARRGFSAVLGLDGQRIIIFGGTTSNTNNITTTDDIINPEDSLYVLDLTNFNWYTPKISGKIPNSRTYHKANIIGNYMVISFGEGYNQTNESDILLLDISYNEEYIWKNNFDLPINVTSPESKKPQNNNASPATLAIMSTALFGVIIVFFGSFFLYRWNKNKRKQNRATIIMPKEEDQDDLPVISIGKTRFSMAQL